MMRRILNVLMALSLLGTCAVFMPAVSAADTELTVAYVYKLFPDGYTLEGVQVIGSGVTKENCTKTNTASLFQVEYGQEQDQTFCTITREILPSDSQAIKLTPLGDNKYSLSFKSLDVQYLETAKKYFPDYTLTTKYVTLSLPQGSSLDTKTYDYTRPILNNTFIEYDWAISTPNVEASGTVKLDATAATYFRVYGGDSPTPTPSASSYATTESATPTLTTSAVQSTSSTKDNTVMYVLIAVVAIGVIAAVLCAVLIARKNKATKAVMPSPGYPNYPPRV